MILYGEKVCHADFGEHCLENCRWHAWCKKINEQQQMINAQRKALDMAQDTLEQMQGDIDDVESKYDLNLIKGHIVEAIKQIAEVMGE
jgi:hypothetical protein